MPKFATTETNPEKHGLFRAINLQSSVAAANKVIQHSANIEIEHSRVSKEDNDIKNWDANKINDLTYQIIYEKINVFNK